MVVVVCSERQRGPGSIVIDTRGVIRDCTEDFARLVGLQRQDMSGQRVRAFLPELPLQPETEGYNIAYATFSEKKRRCWSLRRADGTMLQTTGQMAVSREQGGFSIDIELDHACDHDHASRQATLPASDAPQPRAMRRRFQVAAQDGEQSRIVRITLDGQYRIGFACSAIEEVFGLDYERIVGSPATSLLPDLTHHLGSPESMRTARHRLQQLGSFRSHARHADGREIPVTVSLQKSSFDRLMPLLLQV